MGLKRRRRLGTNKEDLNLRLIRRSRVGTNRRMCRMIMEKFGVQGVIFILFFFLFEEIHKYCIKHLKVYTIHIFLQRAHIKSLKVDIFSKKSQILKL